MSELQNVINKIRQMTNRTVENGCSEAEAYNSALKVGELMKIYNLSIDQIWFDAQEYTTLKTELQGKNRKPVDRSLIAIANFCDCRVWREYEGRYVFFGMETDCQMALYLFNIVTNAIKTESEKFKSSQTYTEYRSRKGARKHLTTSFELAMAVRIATRLKEMKTEQNKETVANSPSVGGQSIVIIKQARLEKEWDKLQSDLKISRPIKRKIRCHNEAFNSGFSAGDRVNLNRPLSNDNKEIKALC